jgi:hypothetical protein
MKYFTFFREDSNFDDILKDVNLKKVIDQVTTWYQHVVITIDEKQAEQLASYITLKFGDSLRNELVKDRAPIMNVDYLPRRK